MDKVNEQFSRLKRWHKRLQEVSYGREHTRASEYYEDILFAFFQNCFHLKDWIVNSNALSKKVVEDFIESNTDLGICRDLCNGSKHLINKSPSVDPNVSVTRREYSITLGGIGPVVEVRYWVCANGIPIDGFNLATNCLILWESFLKREGLLVDTITS